MNDDFKKENDQISKDKYKLTALINSYSEKFEKILSETNTNDLKKLLGDQKLDSIIKNKKIEEFESELSSFVTKNKVQEMYIKELNNELNTLKNKNDTCNQQILNQTQKQLKDELDL